MRWLTPIALLLACACSSTSPTPAPSPSPTSDAATPIPPPAPSPAPVATADGPHISTSAGAPGGVVVMWPRIIPKTDDPDIIALAGQLQQRLKAIAEEAGAADVDVRPAPQRVCRKPDGCQAAMLGAVLAHEETSCVTVALVAKPGPSDTHILPWGGTVRLKQEQVPFRDYPESQMVIRNYVACSDLAGEVDKQKDALVAKLRDAMK